MVLKPDGIIILQIHIFMPSKAAGGQLTITTIQNMKLPQPPTFPPPRPPPLIQQWRENLEGRSPAHLFQIPAKPKLVDPFSCWISTHNRLDVLNSNKQAQHCNFSAVKEATMCPGGVARASDIHAAFAFNAPGGREETSPRGKGLPLWGPLPAFHLQPAALATHITGAPPLTHGGLLPPLLLLLLLPRGGGTDRAPLPPHLSLSWSSVPGSGCTTKWIDVMFCSPSLEGGGQGPGAQGGNGGGAGGRTGEGELGVSFRVSRSHSGAFAPHEGREKNRATRGAGTAGKGSVSTPLSHEPPS